MTAENRQTEEAPKRVRPGRAAKHLGIHPSTLRELVKKGAIPCYFVGNAVRFDLDELDEWAKRRPQDGGGS